MTMTVCVFCASSEAVAEKHREVARDLGRRIAERGWGLMYGGGNIGLMGEVARSCMEAGGHVTGVIPHLLADREVALESVTNLLRTDTMRERKALMDEGSDGFIVLPGGIGTLEELVEIVTLKQLGYHSRPVVLLDETGYWSPLMTLLERMVSEGLAGQELLQLLEVVSSAEEALQAIAEGHTAAKVGPPNDALELETGDNQSPRERGNY